MAKKSVHPKGGVSKPVAPKKPVSMNKGQMPNKKAGNIGC